ncbi:MAG: dihydrolipoyllysine-residue acetyltransferase [Gammaproteobacteria bacterium]|nr:dihydrolipoyllysine-residue acetyltransferase [Gammaproteobacteria bacterium]
MAVEKIQVPDIGDEQEVDVIEILVSPGDDVSENDSLIVLESDKAAMEIPSPKSGVVKEVLVKVGDQVSQGAYIVSIDVGANTGSAEPESSEDLSVVETSAQEAPAKNSIAEEAVEEPTAVEVNPVPTGSVSVQEIRVPDLGGDSDVEVIEILVAEGDVISAEDGLVTLETDKAAMDIPSPAAGKVLAIKLKVGDKVNEGALVLELEVTAASSDFAAAPVVEESQPESKAVESPPLAPAPSGEQELVEIKVPDLGEDSDVEIIEILVTVGDEIKKEEGLITLETDKAAMDVPSPSAGVVKAIKVKIGDKVSQGSVILDLETTASESAAGDKASPAPEQTAPVAEKPQATSSTAQQSVVATVSNRGGEIYAGPAVRKLARELGVDLAKVAGSGFKGRIVKEDVEVYVKGVIKGGAATVSTGGGLPGIEDIDFSKFGEVEEVETSKMHQVIARNMSRNWLNVPHVTQFDEADVTELEEFRQSQKALAEKKGIKLTPLPFIVKACAHALNEYPQFNVSLHSSGTKLIQKKYVHIGIAVATPAGLMVPVLKNVDRKSIWEIATEIAELGEKAKNRKLSKEDMQGACFTVSSLGNLGGTGFTPIVNAPEVAILGVSRTAVKPVYIEGEFVPRKMLPFSLSYDHRAVNGVDGGMFCTFLGTLLDDIRLLAL